MLRSERMDALTSGRKAILLSVASLMFIEVWVPLADWTLTRKPEIFFLSFPAFLAVRLFVRNRLLDLVLGLFIVHVLMNLIYHPDLGPFAAEWWTSVWITGFREAVSLEPGDLLAAGESTVIRSLLFFPVIRIVAGAWGHCLASARLFWLPFGVSAAFLLVMEPTREVSGPLIRLTMYGLLLAAWFRQEELENRSGTSQGKMWRVAVAFLVALVLVNTASSFPGNQVRDAVSWKEWLEEAVEGSTASRIGYGRSDEDLGGPLKQDNRPVFEAEVDAPYYWRGESKEVYTGRGWDKGPYYMKLHLGHLVPEADGAVTIARNESFYNVFLKGQETTNHVNVRIRKPFTDTLFVPGEAFRVNHVNEEPATGAVDFVLHDRMFTSRLFHTGEEPLRSYALESRLPEIREDLLRQKKSRGAGLQYLTFVALPDTVPPRVAELARRLTESAGTDYDKVKAVENWLRSGDLEYETEKVPVTPPGRDFVDHFLFESKTGYCDHFSTSMVVLLRSVGIPARWVKGFTAGEFRYDADIGKYRVTVRNRHAHSWVEVYFQDVGWIPFEPTPPFRFPSPADDRPDGWDGTPVEGDVSGTWEDAETSPDAGQPQTEGGQAENKGADVFARWLIPGATGILILLALVRILRRNAPFIRWGWRWVSAAWNHGNADPLYMGELIRLQEMSGKKHPAATLREHAESVGGALTPEELLWIREYEQARYGSGQGTTTGMKVSKKKLLLRFKP
ncbi:transglutaminase-like domain-containing protein [Staphylospora marina]|uniref:transglutaminase-like domain-containing protein n=1 Tax=Staphylospora marina TaxID=2490858 RepID=UPI0013DE4EE3|nr:transglutaminase-like domain-containing protein [Staphylospora marina]